MIALPTVARFLEEEALALLTRLDRVKPFALQMTSVLAAAVSPGAQMAVERHLAAGRRVLRAMVRRFIVWLHSSVGRFTDPAILQARFTILRLRFNEVLTQFDIFADALVQRSEHEYGTWLGGLDVVAADALELPGYYEAPPVICYLDRGHGAAIRRARTRLPGGGDNPVAVIRVPRERMVGSGIASSLVHEVGHQAAALLDLVGSLRPALQAMQRTDMARRSAWELWERWISEIVADLWAVAKVGVAATTGLMGVCSLPRAFVFRLQMDDPHPFPWIRVKLSCALGAALYPDSQWRRFAELWELFYPCEKVRGQKASFITSLERAIPSFVELLTNHRPAALRGESIAEALVAMNAQPSHLRRLYAGWNGSWEPARTVRPTVAFAVIGQARADGRMSAKMESRWLMELLTHWALRSTLSLTELRASAERASISAPRI